MIKWINRLFLRLPGIQTNCCIKINWHTIAWILHIPRLTGFQSNACIKYPKGNWLTITVSCIKRLEANWLTITGSCTPRVTGFQFHGCTFLYETSCFLASHPRDDRQMRWRMIRTREPALKKKKKENERKSGNSNMCDVFLWNSVAVVVVVVWAERLVLEKGSMIVTW